MIKLLTLLLEAGLTDHYLDRKELRGKILDIVLPREAYEGYDLSTVKSKLLPLVQQDLLKALKVVEGGTYGESQKNILGRIVFRPLLEKEGESYPISLVISTESKTSKGEVYYVIIADNALITFILAPKYDLNQIELNLQFHAKLNKLVKPSKVVDSQSSIFTYNIHKLFDEETKREEESKIDPSTLPYKPKTTYRPGSSFTHEKFGTGKIIAASSGGSRSGDPDSRGIVDWIEVDFDKPYLKGGEFLKTRKLEKIYSSQHFKSSPLNEGPQFGVLYHYTEYLDDILDSNKLIGPVSLTRSQDSYVKDWLGDLPLIVLDKDKLRTKYKITPYTDPGSYMSYRNSDEYGESEEEGRVDEMEEIIYKDIINLDKYIVKVILPHSNEEWELPLKEKNIPYEFK